MSLPAVAAASVEPVAAPAITWEAPSITKEWSMEESKAMEAKPKVMESEWEGLNLSEGCCSKDGYDRRYCECHSYCLCVHR